MTQLDSISRNVLTLQLVIEKLFIYFVSVICVPSPSYIVSIYFNSVLLYILQFINKI